MKRIVCVLACGVMLACSAGCALTAEPEQGTPAAPMEAPINRWVLRSPRTPKNTWENGVAYDPATRLIVQHGGHVLGSYVQSNYTLLYDLKTNKFRESTAPFRPQRRCLVQLNYVDSIGRAITTHGGSGHGAIPQGGLGGDYKRVFKGDPRGPWLYDVQTDRWEDCRILPPGWRRVAHAQGAYDASSDALVYIVRDKLGLFCPRTNRVQFRDLPKALHSRLSYGIAADPVHRKIVVFGGSGPGGWVWVKGDRGDAHKKFVHDDTWLYDIATDQWKQIKTDVRPPRGMPLSDHRSLPMLHHPPSGTVLLLQSPIDAHEADTRKWPATELWSFDVGGETWTKVPTENAPAYTGLLTYATHEDLLVLFGGGPDGARNGPPRPSLSRHLYSVRVRVPGRELLPPARPRRVQLTCHGGVEPHVKLGWPALAGVAYEVYRAVADPFPGPYAKVHTTAPGVGAFKDTSLASGTVYAYQVGAAGAARRSLPAFTQSFRPGEGTASVESARKVTVRWRADPAAPSDAYRVYRARGAEIETGKGTLLTPKPLPSGGSFVDETVDLSDGVARMYWVTAVNDLGIESGASPLAYTMPDAPLSLSAAKVAEGRIRLTWQWPKAVTVAGFNVYEVDNHMNTHGRPREKVRTWYRSWKKLNAEPVTGRQFVFTPPAGSKARHHYFYLRAANVLGQEGFHTDIVSATDRRFRPCAADDGR